MAIYQEIKDALFQILKKSFPSYDVFGEEITKIQADQFQKEVKNFFYVDIMPIKATTLSQYHSERTVYIDIAGYTKSESNADYLHISAVLDHGIRPVLRFADRAIAIHETEMRVVDHVLHYTFSITFVDTIEVTYEEPMMEELDIAFKERM